MTTIALAKHTELNLRKGKNNLTIYFSPDKEERNKITIGTFDYETGATECIDLDFNTFHSELTDMIKRLRIKA